MKLEATLYKPDSARAMPAVFEIRGGMLHVTWQDGAVAQPMSGCLLSEPLGGTARSLEFPDGSRLEFSHKVALEAVAGWEAVSGSRTVYGWVSWLEARWSAVLAAVCVLLGVLVLGYFKGVPLLAERVARKLPHQVSVAVTEQVVLILSGLLRMKDSALPQGRRDAIEARFKAMAEEMDPGSGRNYRLAFRASPVANAVALPDGLVVVTDKLVELAKEDHEIYGVLAHEIVHVRERHGMRSVLQNSAVFFVWTLLSGDLSTVAGAGAAVPTALAESRYSRRFEQEADLGAADYMIRAGWGTAPLRNLLNRLDPEERSLGSAGEVFSSHPNTEKRARVLEDYERARLPR